jgi:hypothetical protein
MKNHCQARQDRRNQICAFGDKLKSLSLQSPLNGEFQPSVLAKLAETIFFIIMIPHTGPTAVYGYDDGPKAVGCDYSLHGRSASDICLINGSGMNQGILWITFEVNGQRYRHASSAPESLKKISATGAVIQAYPIRRAEEQCRPGGKAADVFSFRNGDRICLYW